MKPALWMLLISLPIAAEDVTTPFAAAAEVLREVAPDRAAELSSELAFRRWAEAEDAAIRTRLQRGELDSMVHLLLFGTSFTQQARMTVENLGEEVRAGLLRARLADFVAALQHPGGNERIALVARMLREQKHPPGDAETGVFILQNVQRVLEERIQFAERSGEAAQGAYSGDASLFADRGVSLDTTILPNYGVDRALEALRERGLVATGSVARVAVIGPGLDFADKDSGFDYYPQQTLQPFAIADSLERWGLGPAPQITIFDISKRVLEHVEGVRKQPTYTMQLPRNAAKGWTEGATGYWRQFGSAAGEEVTPLPLPANVKDVVTRAVRVRVPDLEAHDLNIVTGREVLPEEERFDLVVATNILVYYDRAEQALALANIAAMMKPGGWLITNDPLPVVRSIPLRLTGQLDVAYADEPRTGDTMFWYRRQ